MAGIIRAILREDVILGEQEVEKERVRQRASIEEQRLKNKASLDVENIRADLERSKLSAQLDELESKNAHGLKIAEKQQETRKAELDQELEFGRQNVQKRRDELNHDYRSKVVDFHKDVFTMKKELVSGYQKLHGEREDMVTDAFKFQLDKGIKSEEAQRNTKFLSELLTDMGNRDYLLPQLSLGDGRQPRALRSGRSRRARRGAKDDTDSEGDEGIHSK